MKKILTVIAVALFAAAGSLTQAPPVSAASASTSGSYVKGTIYRDNTSTTESDADVKITCGKKQVHTRSDKDGSYQYYFAQGECPSGSLVKTSATTKDGKNTNSKSGYMGSDAKKSSAGGSSNVVTMDIIIIIIIIIPEYGPVGIVAAAGVGIGAIAVMRRRHAGNTTLGV